MSRGGSQLVTPRLGELVRETAKVGYFSGTRMECPENIFHSTIIFSTVSSTSLHAQLSCNQCDPGGQIILFHFLAREETVTNTQPLTTDAAQTSTELLIIDNVSANTAHQGTKKLLLSLRNLLNVSNKV